MEAAATAELGMMHWTHCITHFTNNIGNQFKGCGLPIRQKVKTAASLYTKQEAAVLLHEIELENPAVYQYVQNAGLHTTFRSHTDHARFDIFSNQAVESWNQVTKPWRSLPWLFFFFRKLRKRLLNTSLGAEEKSPKQNRLIKGLAH